MQAIILNSGKGSRLKELTANTPKGLVNLYEETTLLSRQIDLLLSCGIDDIILTTGYLEDQFKAYLGKRYPKLSIRFVYNDLYETTNYIVSLDRLQAIGFDDSLVMMHGDLVFSLDVLMALIDQKSSSVVIDTTAPIPEKDFKARLGSDGLVREIGINVFGKDCFACQPLYKLRWEDWRSWQQAIRLFCKAGTTKVYAENALNSLLEHLVLKAYDVKGGLCMEVDNQEDLLKVKSLLAAPSGSNSSMGELS
jgi:choline kinase